jgi:hypothetical protein
MKYLTVVPAYGRDYKSQKEVRADYEADKDFRICDMSSPYDGAMVNKSDKPANVTLMVRYARLTKVVAIR